MAINKCHVTVSTRTDTKPCMEFKVQQMKSIRINSFIALAAKTQPHLQTYPIFSLLPLEVEKGCKTEVYTSHE